jgi:hypothetical protein
MKPPDVFTRGGPAVALNQDGGFNSLDILPRVVPP